MKCIDTHVHFWKYDKKKFTWINNEMKILRQHYLPEHLSLTLKRSDVDGIVAVQAEQSEFETHFLVELAKTNDIIKGVVGWVDLREKNVADRLEYFSQYPVIKGWRHIVQDEPDDFLYNDNFRSGIKALQAYNCTYDILVYPRQLKAALDFVASFPDQALVIDHCAKPAIRGNNTAEWKNLMGKIAQSPNVYCKLSGLLTETRWKEWSPAEFYPFLDSVFEYFGPDRLMFGSDWPVMLLSGIYIQWKSLLEKYMATMDEETIEKVFRLNAIDFYKL